MSKCNYGRWAIINKEGHEFGNLGWFTNCDKADVLSYCKEHDIKIQKGEHIKVVEETEKFEGHLTPLRKVTNENRGEAAKKLIKDEQNEIEGVLRYYRKVGGQLKTEGIKVLGYRNHTISKMQELLAIFEGK